MENQKDRIELNVPWDDDGNSNKAPTGQSEKATSSFVRERSRLHALYITEQEKTKRISLILAVVLILVAAALLMAAPVGKETLTYIISGVLFVFAAGAVGFKRIWGKIPFAEFEADQDRKG
jgi:hypothetical protein